MKLGNSVKLALVAAASCGVDTTNVFATLPEISGVKAITQDDVGSIFDAVKRSIRDRLQDIYDNNEDYTENFRKHWLNVKKRNFTLEEMADETAKINVPSELKKYIKLYSLDVEENKRLYIAIYSSDLILDLATSDITRAGFNEYLSAPWQLMDNYKGDAWLVSQENTSISLELEFGKMNTYYAVQAIKAATDDQLNGLELNTRELDCKNIIKERGDFADCRHGLKKYGIDKSDMDINWIMAKLKIKGYLNTDCKYEIRPVITFSSEWDAWEEEEEKDGYETRVRGPEGISKAWKSTNKAMEAIDDNWNAIDKARRKMNKAWRAIDRVRNEWRNG